jgi:hypothetical protein
VAFSYAPVPIKPAAPTPTIPAVAPAKPAPIPAVTKPTPATPTGAYKIGDKGPAGGIVFYDKGSTSDGWRYLEAAPVDTDKSIEWYNGKYTHVQTEATVGAGRANTAAIVASQGKGNYAAQVCADLVLGGYDDWFLPSIDELDLMYKNLKKAGQGSFWGPYLVIFPGRRQITAPTTRNPLLRRLGTPFRR